MNEFYAPHTDLVPGTKARSGDINTMDQAIVEAFDRVPSSKGTKTGTLNYVANTSTTVNTYVVTMDAVVTSYTDGLEVKLKPVMANTGPAMLNVNGLGFVAIKRQDGTNVQTNDILLAAMTLTYSTTLNGFIIPPTGNAHVIAAAASASAAAQSAGASASSAGAAAGSASTATTMATASGTSASAASGSATAAAGSATAAQTSATSASGSASAAATSASAASTSASSAGTNATSAATSASTASTKASEAATSASAASASASSAATSAGNLTTAVSAAQTAQGLAQQWASGAGSVDGTNYSAKYYALQAASAANAVTTGQAQADWNQTDSAQKSFILNKPTISTGASFPAGNNRSVSAEGATLRYIANPATGLGYAGGVRFRFGANNDTDSNAGFADVIDLSTYIDSTGGGVNALYLRKDQQRITHKFAGAGVSTWTEKTLAYTSDNVASASKLAASRTIQGVAFDGSQNISLYVPVSGNDNASYLLPANFDLNTLYQTGFYRGQQLTNAPGGNVGSFYITHEQNDSQWAKQTATAYGSGNTATETSLRTKTSGTWGAWTKIADAIYNADYTIKRRRDHYGNSNGASLDGITVPETGFVYTDAAGGLGVSGAFIHFGGLDGGSPGRYGCQIVSSYDSQAGRMLFRTRNDDQGVWNAWREVWHSGNLAPDTAASANSIVRRDASGYVFGSYISMTDDGNPGSNVNPVTAIITKRGDNFYRSATSASVKAYLAILGPDVSTLRTDATRDIGVAQMLRWKNFGNGHVIFDASAGTSPEGGTIDKVNPAGAWQPTYGTLMGWNGTQTYGVRVDTARYAETLAPNSLLVKPTIKGYIEQFQILNGAALAINTDNGTLILFTTTGNTTITLPAPVSGMSYTVAIEYGAAHSVSFVSANGSPIRWAGGVAPASTSTTSKIDKYQFTCIAGVTLAQDGGRGF